MPRYTDVDALWTQMKELHERRAEEDYMTGNDRAVCVTWHDAVVLLKNTPTIDIPTNVAIVVYEDGTVSRITGVKI